MREEGILLFLFLKHRYAYSTYASPGRACMLLQSCLTLQPHGPILFIGFFQTRILERGSSLPRDLSSPPTPASPALADGFFSTELPGKPRISLVVKHWKLPQNSPQKISLRNEKKGLIVQHKRGTDSEEHLFHFIET